MEKITLWLNVFILESSTTSLIQTHTQVGLDSLILPFKVIWFLNRRIQNMILLTQEYIVTT